MAALPPIRLGFVAFWEGFDPRDNFFTRLLSRHFQVEVCDDPDYLIYSCIGSGRKPQRAYDCVRIFFTGENRPPDWSDCDWAFSFEDTSHPRHFRLPLWGTYAHPRDLVKPPGHDAVAVLDRKKKFCAFLVSNPLCRVRNEFFRKLSRYKPVDSGGKVLNTLGYRVGDMHAFLSDYKFTIAFENESHPGYTTEKVVEPMLVGSTPIYWGDPLVGRDFDTRSFLSAHDQGTLSRGWLDDLVDRVVEVDRNPDLHHAMHARPWYRGNQVPRCVDPDAILDQFTRIFETPIERVSRRSGLRHALARLPAEAASIRRRITRKWRKLAAK